MQPLTPSIDHADGRARRSAVTLAAATLLALAPHAHAQRAGREPESLRGSKASVEKMYDFAQRYRYPFYLTPTTLDDAIAKGKLVPLTGDDNYELTRGVGFSYATIEAREFITQFAPQYLAACGVPLTVTSAARPMSRQPHNANPHSVHPTGIAVDIRRPYPGPCLTWVRNALAQLEARGYVEATEEHHPVHLHIAVLRAPGARFTLPDLTNGVRVARQPTTPASPVTTTANGDVRLTAASNDWARTRLYTVRDGDTLWDVAQKTGVSVNALARANNRSPRAVLRPGTTLKLPDPSTR
ncbi:MAG: LysM peptidoglycan-binding domain-containing protein [Gemmatimonadaceae bacterium]|nr:LysM peptidoglycan-binding domain-containing protein [Gemmatimonadaceae bacterium]